MKKLTKFLAVGFLLMSSLTMVHAITVTGGKVYYNNAMSDWSDTYKYMAVLQSSYFTTTSLSTISNTKLLYCSAPNHSGWQNETGICFFQSTSTWETQSSPYSTITTYSTGYTNSISYDLNNSNNYYLFNPSAVSGKSVTASGNWNGTRDNLFKLSNTIKVVVKKAGSTSYAAPTSSSEMPASEVKVVAYYLNGDQSATSNTVTLSGTTYSKTYYACPGGKHTLTQTANTGYTFDGFYIGDTKITSASAYYQTSNSKITIEARYTENTYSITFDANTGSGEMTSQTGLGCATDQTINANSFTAPTGHHFNGWNTQADGEGTPYAAGGTVPAFTVTTQGGTLKLYAQWAPNTHTLSWNWDGGSTTDENYTKAGTVAYGTAIVYPTNASMSYAGHNFTGWDKSNITMPDADLTITAQWEVAATATVTYDGNGNTGGTVPSDTKTYAPNEEVTVLTGTPEKNGYDFAGWKNSVNEQTYYAGQTFKITSNTTLTAQWNVHTYNITYAGVEGATNLNSDKTTYTIEEDDYTFKSASKTGYIFTGWTCGEEPITKLEKGVSYGDKTITATWTPRNDTRYTVKHYWQNIDNNEYTLHETQNLTGTTDVQVTPDRKSYTGFTAPDAQTKTILADGSLVVEYRYTRNEHTLTWEPDGGTLSGTYTSGTVKYGATITAPTASKFGKLFKAWDKAVPSTMPDNDVTLTASYVDAYFFIEGRFHVANAERTPHGAVWTNTFTNTGWDDNSRTIPMVWNEKANRYEVRTFATPKELSTELGTQQEKTPWFYIKASESETAWIGEKAYYAATDDVRQLTTASTKAAIGTETQRFFYFNSEDNTKWVYLCYDASGVYFVLEDIPTYYSINISVASGDESKGTVKPTFLHEINTLAYGTVKAESKDPQLYSFEKWGWKSSSQTEESFDFTSNSGVILHDSCQSTWPEIRVNAAIQNDLALIAHFKDREIVTLYFVDSENWGNNIRMHLWGGFEQGTTWPGIKPNETDLTCNGHKVYSYTFDKGAYEKVKWSKNGDDKSSNFIIDPETPYYNERDGRWYDALSSIAPDKTICANWRIVLNNSDEYFKLVEGSTNTYECFVTNVPEWHNSGDNWLKMKYKGSGDWEWRGFTGISNNQKVESYINATYTASTNNSDQDQLNLAGFTGTQDFVMTFNTSTKKLTIAYPTPKVEIGVKNKQGTVITESDIDSEEGFVLNAYPQNVDKDAQCTYSFQYKKDNGTWTPISGATAKSNTIMGDQLNGPGVYKFRVTMTMGGKDYTSQETGNVTIYKYYWVAIKDNKNDNETSHWASYLHCWGPSGNKLAWPGESISSPTTGDLKTRDGWIYFRLKYPNYNKVLLTNGKTSDSGKDEVKTNDIEINPSAALCYKITGDQYWDGNANKSIWPTSTTGCPHRIFIDNDVNEYWMSVDGALSISPKITYYGTGQLTYTWSTDATNLVLSATDKPDVSILASAVAAKATLTLTVTDGVDEKYYDFYINTQNGINIRVWKCYNDWTPVIRIWADGHSAEHHNMNNEGNGWYSYPVADSWSNVNFMVMKDNNSLEKNLECTADVSGVTESGCWKVSTEQWDNQKHKIDKTEDCGLYYRVEETLADGKTTYHSNKVKKANEAVSFYAANDGKLALQHYDEKENKYVDVKVIDNPTESNVQQATFTGNDITDMTKYEGDYYIRTDGAKGGWDDYKQAGNKFTTFTRNPLFGNEKYNYYWVTTLKGNDKNAKAEVGNEINKCLAQTIGDYVCNQGDANVRFGYCPETNYFTRAIIAGSNVADYLTLYGDNSTYFNGGADNSTLYTDEQLTHKIYDGSPLPFKDLSDWVYEAEVYAAVDVTRPNDTKAVIKSHYFTLTDYLLGYDEKNNRPAYAYTVLGNTSTKNMTFKITVTYDYKMNRLTTAWMPLAGEIEGHLDVDAAIMFLNPVDNGDEVQQITVKDEKSDISSLNNIVYVMEFSETTDVHGQNKETNHWISLPFDCRISDIYGIEGYVTLDNNKMPTDGVWGIQRYDGAGRAQKGRMKQTDTYWTWMGRDEELKAGEGYVLSFDRGATSWPEIEHKRTKRLYFQSKNAGFTLNLSESNATQDVAEHEENASLHRYGHDANWNLIGPLAYNNITINEWTGKQDAPKFLYEFLGKDHEYIEGIGKYRLVNPLEEGTDGKFKFVSFHSYMVQFAGAINWAQYTQTQHDNPATAPLLASADDEFTYTQVRLNLSKEGQLMDKTYICLSEYGTTGYDLNDDLSKITETKANQIGSVINNSIYAANTLPLETEFVDLYVNAAATGEYVIALNQENPYLKVALLDAQTGKTILLDDTDYTVTLDKGEYKDRFFLQFVQKSPLTPTNFNGAIEQFNLPSDKTQKLLINDNIYLINAGRVYNASGTKVR